MEGKDHIHGRNANIILGTCRTHSPQSYNQKICQTKTMPKSTGRNSRLENAWRAILGFFGRTANTPTGQTAPTVPLMGGQFSSQSALTRNYDQEYIELPVRDAFRARRLIDLRQRPEVATALDILVGDVFASQDGDDHGFTVSETLSDNTTPVDPKLRQICLDLIDRLTMGPTLMTVVEEFLIYGDSFRSLVVDSEYSRIVQVKQLPTWEMFRVEDENGVVQRFEQRRMLTDSEPPYQLHPLVCVHWRYRLQYKYGRSLFGEIIEDSDALEQGYFAVDKAAMAIGVNPNVHTMPPGWTAVQAKAYKQAYEAELQKQRRVMTDFFMEHGGDVKKLSSTWNPDLKALIDNVLQRRMRIAMRSRIPPWMIGLPSQGAREIAGQPALAYARFINSIRIVLLQGIRQILDTELAFHGYTRETMRYRVIFPKIFTDPQAAGFAAMKDDDPDESNAEGIEDLDSRRFVVERDRYSTFTLR